MSIKSKAQRQGFEKDLYSHNEVFDEIRQSPFTVKEAAEYLEVAEITLRRWIKAGKIRFRTFSPRQLVNFEKIDAYIFRVKGGGR